MINEYILLFLTGGTFMILTKYLTNHMSTKLGAIIATIPISLFSAYFIVHEDKIPNYLFDYLKQTAFIALATMIYLYLLHNDILPHSTIYVGIISLWILFSFSQYYFSI